MHNKKTFGGAIKWLQKRIESEGMPFHRFFMELLDVQLLGDVFDEAEDNGLDGNKVALREILKVVETPIEHGGLNFSGSTTVHRFLFLSSAVDLREDFGAHWTHDAENFRRPWYFQAFYTQDFKDNMRVHGLESGYILQGDIKPSDVNLTETLIARMNYPEEEEFNIKKRAGGKRSIRNAKLYRFNDFYAGRAPIKTFGR
jgi:hypothetical protein